MEQQRCPFCGCKDTWFETAPIYDDWGGTDAYVANVECQECHAKGPLVRVDKKDGVHYTVAQQAARDAAMAAWSKRID